MSFIRFLSVCSMLFFVSSALATSKVLPLEINPSNVYKIYPIPFSSDSLVIDIAVNLDGVINKFDLKISGQQIFKDSTLPQGWLPDLDGISASCSFSSNFDSCDSINVFFKEKFSEKLEDIANRKNGKEKILLVKITSVQGKWDNCRFEFQWLDK